MMDIKGICAYEFGSFYLDVAERMLLHQGLKIHLPPQIFDILLLLIRERGHLVEKDVLMRSIWANRIVEDNNLTVSMSLLRKAIGEGNGEHKYIETIPRRGYRFVASVKEVQHEAAASPAVVPAGTNAAGGHSQRIKAKEKSIAVLPFRIIGAKAEDEYLGIGMADALITKLSNLRQLAVRPTSAIYKYAGVVQDPVSLGQELQVDSVIEGTIQKLGKKLRVTVQLVSIPEGLSIWAEKFDERFTNIFTLEDSISERVLSALLLKLTNEEKSHLVRQRTKNNEAYKQYLKGRFFWSKSRFYRNKRAEQDSVQSIKHFEQAIMIDPDYGLAHAALSDSYILLSGFNVRPPNDCLLLAKKAALKAMELDDSIAEAHLALARVLSLYDSDPLLAEVEFKRALQIKPSYITAHQWYAKFLAKMGRFQEALSEIDLAHEIDPVSMVVIAERGRILYFARRYDEAIEQCLEALHLDPKLNSARSILGLAYTEMGMYKEAIKHSEKLLSALGDDAEPMAFVAYTYGRAGQMEKAREVLGKCQELVNSRRISPFHMAVIYTGMGENEQALAWLEKTYEEDHFLLNYIMMPNFDSLRSEPRFVDLLKRIKLLA
jgi:DNA-binding winged helix-turn-helix (wHTH) protein/tetratricopeptide (TPR) repeat protein